MTADDRTGREEAIKRAANVLIDVATEDTCADAYDMARALADTGLLRTSGDTGEVLYTREQIEGMHATIDELRAERDRYERIAKLVVADRDRAVAEAAALRARIEGVLDDGIDPRLGHADTCGVELSPGAGYPCSCWKAELRAALDGGQS